MDGSGTGKARSGEVGVFASAGGSFSVLEVSVVDVGSLWACTTIGVSVADGDNGCTDFGLNVLDHGRTTFSLTASKAAETHRSEKNQLNRLEIIDSTDV